MREIKFRAFVENNGIEKIMEVVEMGFDNKCILVCNDSGETFLNNKYKLMQYTGLKDKNGKEIYEGDILSHNSMKAEIIFEHGAFKFKWLDRTTKRIRKYNENIFNNVSLTFEVIGNIYETPELLEGEEC